MKLFSRDIVDGIFDQYYSVLIILKTKDEDEFIELWINHYLNVIGKSGAILIFDNESTSEVVLGVYRKYFTHPQIMIWTYPYPPDSVHNSMFNANLYKNIKKHCDFFVFLDTDEFLFYFDCCSNLLKSEINFYSAMEAIEWSPSVWIENVNLANNIFLIKNKLISGARSGKPIIKSKDFLLIEDSASLNHNINYYKSYKNNSYSLKFFCLHMKNLFPWQRIKSNFNKLKRLHGLDKGVEFDDFIYNIDSYEFRYKGGNMYRDEIKKIIKDIDEGKYNKKISYLSKDCFIIYEDGSMKFFNEELRNELINFWGRRDNLFLA